MAKTGLIVGGVAVAGLGVAAALTDGFGLLKSAEKKTLSPSSIPNTAIATYKTPTPSGPIQAVTDQMSAFGIDFNVQSFGDVKDILVKAQDIPVVQDIVNSLKTSIFG